MGTCDDNRSERMSEESPKVTPKLLAVTVAVVLYLLGSVTVLELYSRPIGLAMLAVAGVAVLIQVFLLPKNQLIAIRQAMEKSERTRVGRAMKLIQYVTWFLLGATVVSWLTRRFWSGA